MDQRISYNIIAYQYTSAQINYLNIHKNPHISPPSAQPRNHDACKKPPAQRVPLERMQQKRPGAQLWKMLSIVSWCQLVTRGCTNQSLGWVTFLSRLHPWGKRARQWWFDQDLVGNQSRPCRCHGKLRWEVSRCRSAAESCRMIAWTGLHSW